MKKLITLLFLCSSLSAIAEEVKNTLVVWAKNGTRVAYALKEDPKVTFTETDLVIVSEGIEVYYSLANMSRITYENDIMSVRDIQTDKVTFKMDGDFLLFPNMKSQSTISLHMLNGTQVFYKTVQNAGEYSFPISYLNSGVYIVTVNGITYKVIKK